MRTARRIRLDACNELFRYVVINAAMSRVFYGEKRDHDDFDVNGFGVNMMIDGVFTSVKPLLYLILISQFDQVATQAQMKGKIEEILETFVYKQFLACKIG